MPRRSERPVDINHTYDVAGRLTRKKLRQIASWFRRLPIPGWKPSASNASTTRPSTPGEIIKAALTEWAKGMVIVSIGVSLLVAVGWAIGALG
jgi:hypothetical protein